MIELNIKVSGKGPSLVLIPGWAMSASVWGGWLDELEKHYQVIRIDLPGQGERVFEQAWTMDELVDVMAEKLPADCYVLGWSLGGMVGLAYASKYASKVNGLIMLASSAKFVQSAAWEHAQQVGIMNTFSEGLLENPLATLKRFVMLQTQGLVSPRKINGILKKSLCKVDINQQAALACGLAVLQHADLREQLAALRCPLLMLMGDKDQLIPAGVGLDSVKYNKHIDLHLIQGASHVPFLSHKDEVTERVLAFIQDKACA